MDVLRVPPQAVDAEQSVLGGLMLAPDALDRIADQLGEQDFYRRDHQLIYRAICELGEKGQPFDAVTLGEWFEAQGLADHVHPAYLVGIASNTPSAANIRAYAGIVRDKAMLRKLIEAGTSIVDNGFDPDGRDSAEVLESAISELMALQKTQTRHEYTLRQALNMAMADMQEAHASSGALRGITCGFSRIDKRLGGFHPGDLILIGARPKMGKTALALNAAYAAASAGSPVGIVSGEQSALQIAQRLIALQTSIAGERMRNGQIEEHEWATLTAGVREILARKIQIFDAGGPKIAQVHAMARKWKKEHGIKALYVDYLQRIKGKARDRTEEVGEVARGLKDIGRELDIPVIALAQVKREVESRADKRPTAADIANSDEATREADQIFMLYRDEVYNQNSPDKGVAELNLEANRHGPTGSFKLAWMQESMRFGDLESAPW